MLGIYGGTFDPVHYGHLRTALEVKEALGITDLRFLPCRSPPHRGSPGASPEQRLTMLELALQNAGGGFSVDRRELDREGLSYMVDTLTSLRAEVADQPICLILGLDAFAAIPAWHRWRDLFYLAHLAVMQRPGSPDPAWAREISDIVMERRVNDPRDLQASPFGKIVFLKVSQLAISATAIRHLIACGRCARYLLPDPVLAMIQSTGLYCPPKAEPGN
ncbi:MAG: nicotinate-nucleotide adenylyltransferase [Proteobacteria bacterium]|nr:nicotinate-nucleotide adenylyltransferase [Pseudomonadota bacterium]